MKEVIFINKIRSFINRNKKLIINVLLIGVFAILVIYILNYYYAKMEEDRQKELENTGINTGNPYSNAVNVTLDNLEDESVNNISNDSIANTMKLFVSYCNSGDAENAYQFLTEECKTALKYYDADTFKEFYIDLRFEEPQEYSISRVSSDGNNILCRITFNGDLLATGGSKFTSNDEYYTFVRQDDETYKINVNNYIYGEVRNTRYVYDNLDVKVIKVDAYSRYEEITMELENTSEKTIAFVGESEDNVICLVSSEGTVYSSINSEFDEEIVTLKPEETKEVTVRFNKVYSATNKAKNIVFSKIILDYDEYLETHNRTAYSNYTAIQVNYN